MRVSRTMIAAALAAVACSAVRSTAVNAQQQTQSVTPDTTISRVVALYNRDSTTRIAGNARLATGTTIGGDVAALNGTLEISAHVTGDVVAINGDVHVLATGSVDGSITAIGGVVRIDEGAKVGGAVTSYRELLRVRVDDDGIEYVPPPEERGISAGRDFPFGRTELLIAVRGSYNRVEGMPIAFGPRLTFGAHRPTKLQALAIYKSTNGIRIDPDRLGYILGAEHYINSKVRVEGSLYRDVATIEDWGLSDREATLAALLMHRDYRDHYERRGWSIGTRLKREGVPYEIGLEFRNESNRSTAPADPVALFNNKEAWVPEPLVAEGRLHALMATFGYDTRNDLTDPADGWLVRASLEQGLGGSLKPDPESLLPLDERRVAEFTAAHIDVRRYARLTPYSRLAMRILATGSVDGSALPPQRQKTLGGEGSLPGYPLRALDCGARSTTVTSGQQFYPYHGCDRAAVMQLELQSNFPMARKLGQKLRLGNVLTNSVRWSAFIDAGRAWTEPSALHGRAPGGDDFSADAGLGLKLGPFGAYWAIPLSGSDHKYNFFIRLGQRL